jgi:O-methyltransferase involved in polyketide biosynthesis
VYVPIDFATGSLKEALTASGYSLGEPAFVSWLGVVPYLELTAIEETLRFAGSLPQGTIVFDYGIPPSALSTAGRLVFRGMARRVAASGEPWKTFFAPKEIVALLQAAGFLERGAIRPSGVQRALLRGSQRWSTHRRDDAHRQGGGLSTANRWR